MKNPATMGKLLLIAGPCVIENDIVPFEVAEEVKAICERLNIDYVFKSSFKKANRTKLNSFVGMEELEALDILRRVKDECDVQVLTDVHETTDVEKVAAFVDYLQIPAFLCRQTDLLIEAGKTGKWVNIKKGQFASPESMRFAVEKVRYTGNDKVILTERGTTFGYQDLVVDFRNIPKMQALGVPVIVDCTHSLQKPNQSEGVSGGDVEMIETICKAAIAVGAEGLFIETHPDPEQALSDAKSMLPLYLLEDILERCVRIWESLR